MNENAAEKDALGFVPTSTGPRWRGKYRCAYCAVSGWVEGWTNHPRWWGHKHGENCPKKPPVIPSEVGDSA